jgi:cysteine synthase A
VEASFLFDVVDHVIEVPDAASIAAAWLLGDLLGRRYGGSSGTNLVACLQLAAAMRARRQRGSIVTLLCDRGERYAETLFDPTWLTTHGIRQASWDVALRQCLADAQWHDADMACATHE